MGWFGNNFSDEMNATDDGNQAYVFQDDEEEEEDLEAPPAGAAEDEEQQQGLSSFLNGNDEAEEDPPQQITTTTNQPQTRNDNMEEEGTKRAMMERAPAPHRNPLYTCRRFWSELWCFQSWFHLSERVNQRELDVPESFAPFSCIAFLWKCVLAGTCVGTLAYSFLETSYPDFHLIFLTQWTAVATTLYSIMSVLNTIFAARTPQPHAETVGFRIRLTWVLFELSVHMGACVTLLFWYFLFDKDDHLEYLPLALHGGLFLLVLFDGFHVNRIPLRWMHYFGIVMPIEALYSLWTYIHHVAKIGNPNESGTDGNDDAIYPGVIQWDEGFVEPLAYLLIIVLVVGPILFCILWCAGNGNFCCRDTRRYFDDPIVDDDGRPTVDDVQEGSIFSLWK